MREIVTLKNIGKSYQKQVVLKNVNLQFMRGKIYGIVGPNGAGKTTIFKILAGLIQQTKGEITFFEGTMEPEYARKKISFMIENPYLEMRMTAYENMKMLAILYEVPEKKIRELLQRVGLETTGKKKVQNFSLGMKQRLGIAMALLKNPDMIVLDEPMNGLDPRGIIDMREMLAELCEKEQVTILISSHILSELSVLADEFFFINKGCVVDSLSKKEIEEKGNDLEQYYLEKIV